MKQNLLVLSLLLLASVGCTDSQKIVEPNRDNFNAGEVEIHTGAIVEDPSDDEDSAPE